MGRKAEAPAVEENILRLEQGKERVGKTRLTELAYRRLEELIVTLKLPPGSAVSEGELCTLLSIGRTPVREALQRLAREHLVKIIPNRGVLVSPIDVGEQLKVLELRRETERLIARLAALRATPAERTRLTGMAAEMVQAAAAGDEIGFFRLDNEFNRLMAKATQNRFVASAIDLTHALSRRFWFLHRIVDMPFVARLHADIARATAAGDAPGAMRACDALMDYLEAFTRSTIDQTPG